MIQECVRIECWVISRNEPLVKVFQSHVFHFPFKGKTKDTPRTKESLCMIMRNTIHPTTGIQAAELNTKTSWGRLQCLTHGGKFVWLFRVPYLVYLSSVWILRKAISIANAYEYMKGHLFELRWKIWTWLIIAVIHTATHNLSICEILKRIQSWTGCESMTSAIRGSALPTELSSHLGADHKVRNMWPQFHNCLIFVYNCNDQSYHVFIAISIVWNGISFSCSSP